ncbi:hypothetical protein DH2020_037923 [Rehmannia glutinosa]|uniref:Uncharacterized protein n=1 Tax=Rehmannia glutinosa TaxID=99300 RepID=A0ABR0V2U7_REHGL
MDDQGRKMLTSKWGIERHFWRTSVRRFSQARRVLLRSSRRTDFHHIIAHREIYCAEKPQGKIEGERPVTPLIITAAVANFWVRRVLMDSGRYMDIISHCAFYHLGFEDSSLTRVIATLQDLSQQEIPILGEVALPFSLGRYPR